MLIAYTTVSKEDEAVAMAEGLMARRLAVCVQIDGPIRSHFVWEGKASWESEYRVVVKMLPEALKDAEQWVAANHPYDVPEWIVIKADAVSEKYLSWARSVRNS